jgi:hypothetical protein
MFEHQALLSLDGMRLIGVFLGIDTLILWEEGDPMKASFLAIAIFALVVLRAPDLRAQAYGPYYPPYGDAQYQQYLQYQHYLQWQQYLDYLRQTDPYYDLHVMHYQLYLPPYQAYQTYPPCCYAFGIPARSTPLSLALRAPGSRAPQAVRRR